MTNDDDAGTRLWSRADQMATAARKAGRPRAASLLDELAGKIVDEVQLREARREVLEAHPPTPLKDMLGDLSDVRSID
jgi:hypothetical protein